MAIMFRSRWLARIDQERIRQAIAEAERRTSGEIRVSISRFFWGPVRPVAERAFRRLKMNETRDRNGVLFFVVPARRRFVVLGDEGIHTHVGADFWTETAAALSARFKKSEFTEGLVEGIRAAGECLAAHFPYDEASDVNELSDEIDFGKS